MISPEHLTYLSAANVRDMLKSAKDENGGLIGIGWQSARAHIMRWETLADRNQEASAHAHTHTDKVNTRFNRVHVSACVNLSLASLINFASAEPRHNLLVTAGRRQTKGGSLKQDLI